MKSTHKLLKSIVHPTSLYGAGIWGSGYFEQLERVQQFFFKRILQIPRATPGYFVRVETGTLHTRFEVLKQVYGFWVRILTSKADSLVRAAYDELRRVSASLDAEEAKYSWCRQLEIVLEELNLHHLWKSGSANSVLRSRALFLQSLESSCRTFDLDQVKKSSFIPHYHSILPIKRSAPYLNFNLPLYTIRKIVQIRLNLNTIFYEDRVIDLGMWEEKFCKFCGNQLSLSHALCECPNNVKLRQQLSFTCTDQLSYLNFLSDIANVKHTSIQYKNIYVFVQNVIKNYV